MPATTTSSDLRVSDLSRRLFRTINAVVEPTLSTGLGNPLPIGVGAVVVETTGRVSGKARRVPVVAARAGDRILVSTVRGDSHWLANLEANSTAKVQLFGRDRDAAAEVIRGPLNLAVLTFD
ncbi:MAG: nitroreductase family deazaflavin-dependent oxidoreductase [Acidimicrobiia bacterium]|nr:nitroreductase family deazaflavin-dependent oxidoreductase [Acidimicrobiia bacterium]